MIALKPCPFCGGRAVEWVDVVHEPVGHTAGVRCNRCSMIGPARFSEKGIDRARSAAMRAWNRRV